MRAVVVDDERHAADELVHLLTELGDVEVVATCANAFEALRAVSSLAPDALFLDVQMPQVNGFELLGMIDEDLVPSVVFVTAYDEFALRAFEENALDYLLKPVTPERLARAVEKVRRMAGEPRHVLHAAAPVGRVPCSGPGQTIRLVDVDEVELVRSGAAGVYVVTGGGEHFTDLTLRVLETRTGRLTRCHKQFLVNLDHVVEIARTADGALVRTRSGKEVPVSRRLLPRLKDAFGIRHRQRRA